MSRIEEADRENPHKKMNESITDKLPWMSEDDVTSHWILRMCYAGNRDQFVNLEGHLFKLQLELTLAGMDEQRKHDYLLLILKQFYSEVDYPLVEVTDDKSRDKFIRVPFEDTYSLIADHKIVVRDGISNVPSSKYGILIRLLFVRNLKEEMASIGPEVERILAEDDRLKKLVEDLPKVNFGRDYQKAEHSSQRGKINLGEIYILAQQHFPLCMMEMHQELVTKHHLRHYGRLQYGSFIKGIGMTVEDARTYFKREFSKGDAKKLNEYMYYVDHMYGLKGKKTDYTPWGCAKMITQNAPGSGDVHGCPFEFYGEQALVTALRRKLNPEQVALVIEAWKSPSKGKNKNPTVVVI